VIRKGILVRASAIKFAAIFRSARPTFPFGLRWGSPEQACIAHHAGMRRTIRR